MRWGKAVGKLFLALLNNSDSPNLQKSANLIDLWNLLGFRKFSPKTICLISSINVSNGNFEIASEKQNKHFLFCVQESKSWLFLWSKIFVHSHWSWYSNSNFKIVRDLTTRINVSFASFRLFAREFFWNIIVFHHFWQLQFLFPQGIFQLHMVNFYRCIEL